MYKPPKITECPIQKEEIVEQIRDFDDQDAHLATIEVKIVRLHE